MSFELCEFLPLLFLIIKIHVHFHFISIKSISFFCLNKKTNKEKINTHIRKKPKPTDQPNKNKQAKSTPKKNLKPRKPHNQKKPTKKKATKKTPPRKPFCTSKLSNLSFCSGGMVSHWPFPLTGGKEINFVL